MLASILSTPWLHKRYSIIEVRTLRPSLIAKARALEHVGARPHRLYFEADDL